MSRSVKFYFLMLFVLSACVLAILASSPLWEPIPGRDSGVYLLVARTILGGGAPYRDIWDHKPPLTYLIDALGLWISPSGLDTYWGVWLLELCSLFASALLLGATARRCFGDYAAAIALSLTPLLVYRYLGFGNNPEEWCL
ncbi:MAG: hypothetical protein ACREKE_09680, partial [bacterium]